VAAEDEAGGATVAMEEAACHGEIILADNRS